MGERVSIAGAVVAVCIIVPEAVDAAETGCSERAPPVGTLVSATSVPVNRLGERVQVGPGQPICRGDQIVPSDASGEVQMNDDTSVRFEPHRGHIFDGRPPRPDSTRPAGSASNDATVLRARDDNAKTGLAAATVGAITYVGGEVNLTAAIEEQIAVPVGQDVHTASSQATIFEGSIVKGPVVASGEAKGQVATAIGGRSTASNHQASIGASRGGKGGGSR